MRRFNIWKLWLVQWLGVGEGVRLWLQLGGCVWDVGVFGMLGLVVLDLSLVWIGCLFIQVRPGMTDLDGKDNAKTIIMFNRINRDCSTLEQKKHCYW